MVEWRNKLKDTSKRKPEKCRVQNIPRMLDQVSSTSQWHKKEEGGGEIILNFKNLQ